MALSPSHKLGQIIGDMLEQMIRPALQEIADRHGLYLDYKHPRPTRENRKKVSWIDGQGNSHDLDYVLERGGSETEIGSPKAFIESAWRRYTKHSRNKSQELQSAIVPLSQRYHEHHPFLGVVLGGVFTSGSLAQLRSHGFSILYIPYESIVATFKNGGVDVTFDESTATPQLHRKVNAYERLSQRKRGWIAGELAAAHHAELRQFLDELESSLGRALAKIVIIPLSGQAVEVRSVDEAVGVVRRYDEKTPVSKFIRYEIYATYSNGDTVHGQFQEKQTAIEFIANLGHR